MALEGQIKQFGIADIIQLIAQQQKTGILLTEKNQERAEVCFVDGQVTEARTFQQKSRVPLGDLLVKAELLSAANLQKALEKQKNTFELLGRILVQEGLINKDDLQKAIHTQVYETFYDILQWSEGTYRFVSEKIKSDPDFSFPTGLESILLDVLRMIDEWPDIKKTIKSFDMVFAKAPEQNPDELLEDDSLVYSFVDGNNTVREIINKTLFGRFTVCKTLVELLQQKYITLTSAKVKKRKSGDEAFFRNVCGVLSYAGILIALCLLILLPQKLPQSILPIINPQELKGSYLQNYFRHRKVQKLEKALEIYGLQNGSYPESTDELVSAGLLQTEDLKAFGKDAIVYSKDEDYYTITLNE